MAGPLKVRMALVTGTALEPGSGRAIDLVLDERGADVVIHGVGHDGEGLERVREVRARTLLDVACGTGWHLECLRALDQVEWPTSAQDGGGGRFRCRP